MNKRMRTVIGVWVVSVVLLATSGCIGTGSRLRIGELRRESRTIERGSSDAVRVEIEMGAGDLEVSGGAAGLLEADFAYNVAKFKPEVEYGNGLLTVRQPGYEGRASLWDVDDYRYDWDLRLNDEVRTEMAVQVGAGKTDLELGSLDLTSLEIETGAGEVTADLRGASSLAGLTIKVGAGQLTADLTGAREVDLDATIEGGVGEATLRLPRDVGVRVQVEGGLGAVNANGFTKEGNTYVNGAYGQSAAALRIEVEAGIGAINLELGE